MSAHDGIRKRSIETPLGDMKIREKKWNKGGDDEHWAFTQSLTNHDTDMSTGEMLGVLLTQYSVAYKLIEDGYKFHSMVDDTTILWTKYSNDDKSNQN